MVNWRMHNGAVRRLDEIRYIPNFGWNLNSLSRLESSNYRWIASDGILKVIHDDRIILEEKKRMREHYY